MDKTFGKRGVGLVGWAAAMSTVALLSGCAEAPLTRPGVTQSQQFADESACRVQADRQAPQDFRSGFLGTTEPVYRGTRRNMWGEKVEVYSPPQPIYGTIDVNEDARKHIFQQCMGQRGYYPAPK